MKQSCRYVFLFWLMLVTQHVFADATVKTDWARADIKHKSGLLWKILTPDAEPSYLLGTMHTEDPRVIDLPEEIEQAFDMHAVDIYGFNFWPFMFFFI